MWNRHVSFDYTQMHVCHRFAEGKTIINDKESKKMKKGKKKTQIRKRQRKNSTEGQLINVAL